ncbi:MAG: AAA family ATPase, partial [Desulfobacterales bacterium]
MLLHPTIEKLHTLRFTGMAAALQEQMEMDITDSLSFEERLGLLLDREQAVRETRKMQTSLRKAKLRQDAAVEDIDFRHPRKLDKSLVVRLADCQWIKDHTSLIITGPNGVGKSYLACAFAQKACREGYSALYFRMSKLFEDLALA